MWQTSVDTDDNSRSRNGQPRQNWRKPTQLLSWKTETIQVFICQGWRVLTQKCRALALSWKGTVQYLNFVWSHIIKASVCITQLRIISKCLSMDIPCSLHQWLALFGHSDINNIRTFYFLWCVSHSMTTTNPVSQCRTIKHQSWCRCMFCNYICPSPFKRQNGGEKKFQLFHSSQQVLQERKNLFPPSDIFYYQSNTLRSRGLNLGGIWNLNSCLHVPKKYLRMLKESTKTLVRI